MKGFDNIDEDFVIDHKKDILIGAGVGAFATALVLGTGVHFFNGEIQTNKMNVQDNHLEEEAEITSTPTEDAFVDETESLGDFIIPDRIIEDGKDYVTLRLPVGYSLYLVDKEKGVGMLEVSSENGYNFYTGPNGRDLEGYVGVKDTLRYMIGAAETMNAAILTDNYEIVAAQKPEMAPRGVKAPAGFVLYHPPGEDGMGIDFIGGQIFSDIDQGIIPIEDGKSLDGYVVMPGSYAQMLMVADKTLKEMENFYYGYYSKTNN